MSYEIVESWYQKQSIGGLRYKGTLRYFHRRDFVRSPASNPQSGPPSDLLAIPRCWKMFRSSNAQCAP